MSPRLMEQGPNFNIRNEIHTMRPAYDMYRYTTVRQNRRFQTAFKSSAAHLLHELPLDGNSNALGHCDAKL